MYRLLLIVFLCLPISAQAAVVIHEIAWMGTAMSANDEWIELHNTGSSDVSFDGWTLSDGMNLSIALSGMIAAGDYAVLERTDDTTAPGAAFLIYTGSLTNGGATLTLTRADGSIEDSVAGGEDWENIGGDNTTKETAQYTERGWTTGSPTPGRSNVSHTPPAQPETIVFDRAANTKEQSTDPVRTLSQSKSVAATKKIALPVERELMLALTAPTVAYMHQPIEFVLEPTGLPDVLLKSVRVDWNFGDLTTVRGHKVTHQYDFPGKYVVMISAVFGEHETTLRHEMTVLPVSFSITHTAAGDVQINNDSKYEVDLSGYSIRGDRTIVMPAGTILLPNATLTIAREKLGRSDMAWLMDQAHMVVASTRGAASDVLATTAAVNVEAPVVLAATPPAPQISAISYSQPESTSETIRSNFTFADTEVSREEDVAAIAVDDRPVPTAPATGTAPSANQNLATVNQAETPISSDKLPYLGLIGVLSLGILALYATRVK